MKKISVVVSMLLYLLLASCQLPLVDLASDGNVAAGNALDVGSRALSGFPSFQYIKTVQPANPVYDPTGEFIFPHIIKASDYVASPLATYYMYYAPHDPPGGICLAYSDNIEGPYTEYAANPIVSRTTGGISVSHVSSPYVIWMPEYNQFFMYYHGENTTNRWARSADGINWTYGGVSLTSSQFGAGYTECQYAKVYRYTIPGQSNTYIMLSMLLNGTGDGRKIALSVSNDGKVFTPYDADLISPGPDGCVNISGANFYQRNGKFYVIYHGNTGDMYATEVGADFSLENHLGVFHAALSTAPDNNRSAAPSFIQVGSTNYMFYEAGQRGSTVIALAKENGTDLLYEAESLSTAATGATQSDFSDPLCSGGAGNKLDSDGIGDYVEYQVTVPSSGVWNLYSRVKKHNARGIVQLSLPQANVNVGTAQDLYSASNSYVELFLGSYNFASAGAKTLRFTVTGKNASSQGYTIALDTIRIAK